jgi:chemotaxis protein CheX
MNSSNPAPTSPAPTSATGRESWLPTLQLAMQEVFDLMLACPLEVPEKPPSEEGLEITSMVGLAGQLCGVLTVRCSAKSAARMAARMLGIEADHAGPEMWDAVGEICNMVAGNFKNKIAGLGDGSILSVPTVITGTEYSLHSIVKDEIRTVLLFEGEPVVLSLEVHN